MLTAKSAVEKEKDATWKEVRHLISSKYCCPMFLTQANLLAILALLSEPTQGE